MTTITLTDEQIIEITRQGILRDIKIATRDTLYAIPLDTLAALHRALEFYSTTEQWDEYCEENY